MIVVALDVNPGIQDRDVASALHRRDVREDTFRSSGAGGQHRNKTDSGIRLTHLPTGTVVTATEERSQHQNRAVAWSRLEAKLTTAAEHQAHAAVNADRRAAYDEFRAWTWTGWRDEVKGPGVKASMSRVLSGRIGLLSPRH